MFVDEVDIRVTAGGGGNGCMSFRREKFVPRGGPNGGDGGRGGSIYVVATDHLNTLINYRYHPEFRARHGVHGQGSNRTGHDAPDINLDVPVGTLVYEVQPDGEEHLLADLTEAGQRVLVAAGGMGGRGNAHFATSTNRAPRRAEPGVPGEEKQLRLQLRLLADVGLVGFPNAGKSTIISRISAAKPKIADYPFTTLTPHLGVVSMSDDRSFVVADVPGLIEGAHEGAGLGLQFLKHVERTKVLAHIIDVSEASGRDPIEDFETLRHELRMFDASLVERPQIVVANKIDVLADQSRLEKLTAHVEALGLNVFRVSAVTGQGVPELLEAMWRPIEEARQRNLSSPVVAESESAAVSKSESPNVRRSDDLNNL